MKALAVTIAAITSTVAQAHEINKMSHIWHNLLELHHGSPLIVITMVAGCLAAAIKIISRKSD